MTPAAGKALSAAALLLILLSGGATVAYLGEKTFWGKSLREGDLVPPFTVTSVDQRELSSESLRGRKYLVVFFSVDCEHCRKALPLLQQALSDLADAEMSTVAVSVSPEEKTIAFLDDSGTSLPFVVAQKNLTLTFRVTRLPTLFLIDETGHVRKRCAGARSLEFYHNTLAEFAAGSAFEGAQTQPTK